MYASPRQVAPWRWERGGAVEDAAIFLTLVQAQQPPPRGKAPRGLLRSSGGPPPTPLPGPCSRLRTADFATHSLPAKLPVECLGAGRKGEGRACKLQGRHRAFIQAALSPDQPSPLGRESTSLC